MKNGLAQVVGKTISGVLVAANDVSPQNQVFLIFDDGTYFEFWGSSFNCGGGVDEGGAAEARRYAERSGAKIAAEYPIGASKRLP